MAHNSTPQSKAAIARRVIEVLDYFDEIRREATVMKIAHRYDRPQSSTSDLLATLVELGLLRRDAHARTYSLTPRSALIGTLGQPEFIRDGCVLHLMDRLAAQTGFSVALHSMVGIDAQIASWRQGPRMPPSKLELAGGTKEPLSRSTPGMLLLSTIARPRLDSILRRLNAEAPPASRFQFTQMMARVCDCRDRGFGQGHAGFNTGAEAVSCLLPGQPEGQPLVISIVYVPQDEVNAKTLQQCMNRAICEYLPEADDAADFEQVPHAA